MENCKVTITETEKITEWRTERAIIKVHQPILSEEEYAKRRKKSEKALERFYKGIIACGLDWDECVRECEELKKERQNKRLNRNSS